MIPKEIIKKIAEAGTYSETEPAPASPIKYNEFIVVGVITARTKHHLCCTCTVHSVCNLISIENSGRM